CGLAEQLDVTIPSHEELHRIVVAHVAKTAPQFDIGDQRFETESVILRSAPQRSEGARLEGRLILSGGGTWQHDPTLAGMRA
ncbi:MAG: hypothetical protein JO146_01395, partial [Candidatus Eremiobacteraeota bacterium]|nr:hypothetical protein [Candidatus Eremiobacteraeota bacterium]